MRHTLLIPQALTAGAEGMDYLTYICLQDLDGLQGLFGTKEFKTLEQKKCKK